MDVDKVEGDEIGGVFFWEKEGESIAVGPPN